MIELAVNARFRNRPLTGVERFATEVCRQLATDDSVSFREIDPGRPLAGLRGHAWEQFVLPRKRDGAILFSPCNTGPVSVRRQFPVIHDAAVWDNPEGFSRQFGILYRTLLPRLALQVPIIGTVSEFSRSRLVECLGIPEEKLVVLGNAVDARFQPGAEQPDNRRPDERRPTLLCVGSLDPRKNLNRLLSAWKTLKETGRIPPEAILEVVGSANPRNFAAFDSGEAPDVEWLGRLSDDELIKRYREATAFIFPSFYEGFGLPPLEAMACGCPVLLSHAASLPEVGGPEFTDSNSEGAVFYFDPLSVEEIGARIEDLFRLDGPAAERLRANALSRAAGFSWKTVADRTLSAISRIA